MLHKMFRLPALMWRGRRGGRGILQITIQGGAVKGNHDDFAAVVVVAVLSFLGDIRRRFWSIRNRLPIRVDPWKIDLQLFRVLAKPFRRQHGNPFATLSYSGSAMRQTFVASPEFCN
jgi:hypothetical protein